MNLVSIHKGHTPLILSQPHTGCFVPENIMQNFNKTGRSLKDTDWHIDLIYNKIAKELGASILKANFSRYVIDPNRNLDNCSLYPGQATTGLCPILTFDGEEIYKTGFQPDQMEIEHRIKHFYLPYHHTLRKLIQQAKHQFGYVLLYDCHSIKSYIPRLFEGKLPDLNIGTNDHASCDERITNKIKEICEQETSYHTVVNGRFKGGYITRHYGKPDASIFAIQMEISQNTYMQEYPPWTLNQKKSDHLKTLLYNVLVSFLKTGKSIIEK